MQGRPIVRRQPFYFKTANEDMLIASRKKKENIAEYLLYMWQIEDLIRANGLKMEAIETTLIDRFDCSADDRKRMYEWYESLIEMMRQENKQKEGHIQLVENVMIDLTDLHLRLLQAAREPMYTSAYYKTLPYLAELRSKAPQQEKTDLELCFSALYGVLLLKLQHKEVSEATMVAVKNISSFLALLAQYYKKDANGELKWEDD